MNMARFNLWNTWLTALIFATLCSSLTGRTYASEHTSNYVEMENVLRQLAAEQQQLKQENQKLNRNMTVMSSALAAIKAELNSYGIFGLVKEVEKLRSELNTYNLYGMHQDIRALQQYNTALSQSIVAVEGGVAKALTESARNADDISSQGREIITIKDKVNIGNTLFNLEKKDMHAKLKEIAARIEVIEKELGLDGDEDDSNKSSEGTMTLIP